MKRKFLMILFVLAITAGIVHSQSLVAQYCNPTSSGSINTYAPWYCTDINPFITNEWAQYFPILFLAVTLSYTLASVLFMFGVALRNDKLRTFGMGELYEATATAIMAILFTFIAAVLFGLLPSMTTGTINPYDTSLAYISTTINTTYSTLSNLFYITAVDGGYTSFTISGTVLGVNVPDYLTLLTAPFYYFFFWPAFSILGFMFEALISFYTQFYLITFFMYAAIPVFLIPGVIFRALMPTRNLGGMMMAMAIGFYFIMPLLFSVAYYFTSTSIQSQLSQTNAVLNRYSGNLQDSVDQAASPGAPLVTTLTQARSALGSYWLSILFFPVLILAMTYMIITQIAEILGGMGKTSSKLRSLV